MRKRPGLSRRDFLKTSAAGAVTASVAPGALLGAAAVAGVASIGESEAATGLWGPGAVPITLDVNGKPRKLELELEPRVTLLEALRDHLGLTGAKKVCDRGTCGACTVEIDGRPAYACSVLAIEAQGRKIATVEGLAPASGGLHPVQAAFVDNDALQCGFCTPGFVMAAKCLLDGQPSPTDEAIDRGLGGNLCRCGTYAGVRLAVKSAARAASGRKG